MAKYRNPATGEIMEIGNPELNPQLVAGKERVVDTTPTGSIQSSQLQNVSTPNFQTPQIQSPYDISSLGDVQLAPVQTEASELSKRIRQQQSALTEESQFRAQQAEVTGLNAEQQAQDDLAVQLRDLQKESLAIPLQLQQEATGRGITTGGLAPIQTARLRENAIKALGVSALIDASSNRLISAQRKLDRMVEEKYGKQKAELAANLANLKLIQESPEFTQAEKNQALQTQFRQQMFLKQLNSLAEQEKERNDMAVKIIGLNPNIPSNVKQALLAAKDATEAALVANLMGLNLQKTPTPEEQAQSKADLAYKEAQTAKVYSDIAKTDAETKAKLAEGIITPVEAGKTQTTINLVKNSLADAYNLAHASGKTGILSKSKRFVFGADAFTNLIAQTNTIRTNVLTMMADPNVKKFFGPQMSNADVQLMTSIGTTLNPELQSPEALKTELGRIADLILRAEMALREQKI